MDEDVETTEETPSWAWSWWCVPTALALGARVVVGSLVQDVVAAYNHHRFELDQQKFALDARGEIETLTKGI